MTILDADTKFPVHCANIPGDKYLTHEGGDKAYQGAPSFFQKAVASAKALAQKAGPGWTGYVHYNLGWHYSATSPRGQIKLYEDAPGKRFSTLFTKGSCYVGRGSSPKAAYRDIIKQMKKNIASCEAMLEVL